MLAANGASPNAFTSNDITGYYFDSTEKFEENLRILLSFVSVPWFTQESVDKERPVQAEAHVHAPVVGGEKGVALLKLRLGEDEHVQPVTGSAI